MADDTDNSNVYNLPVSDDILQRPPELPDPGRLFPPPPAPPETPEETTMEIPAIPRPMEPEMALRSEGISPAPDIPSQETGLGSEEYGPAEYVEPRSFADRIGDWMENRIAAAKEKREAEAPYREAMIARKIELLKAKTDRETSLAEKRNELRKAELGAQAARASARGKSGAAGTKTGSGSGSGSGGGGGGSTAGRGGGGRTGSGGSGGKTPPKPPGPRNTSPTNGAAADRSSSRSNSGGTGHGGKQQRADRRAGRDQHQADRRSGKDKHRADRQAGKDKHRADRQAARDQHRADRRTGKDQRKAERRAAKDQRKADQKAGKSADDLGQKNSKATSDGDKPKDTDKGKGRFRIPGGVTPWKNRRGAGGKGGEKADLPKGVKHGTTEAHDVHGCRCDRCVKAALADTKQPDGKADSGDWKDALKKGPSKPSDGSEGTSRDEESTKGGKGPEEPPEGVNSADDTAFWQAIIDALKNRRPRSKRAKQPPGAGTDGQDESRFGQAEPPEAEFVGRTRRPDPEQDSEEDIVDAVIVDDPAPPSTDGQPPGLTVGQPTAYPPRPGTSRPPDPPQEPPMAPEQSPAPRTTTSSAARGRTGMAAKHRTDITLDEYLMSMANIAVNAERDQQEMAKAAPLVALVGGVLAHMAKDLEDDHNVDPEVADLVHEMARDAGRMVKAFHQAEKASADAAQAAAQAAQDVARVYGQDQAAMDEGGVAQASAAVHHD
ncbi:hypothetical protein [Streptomyces diastaticus]|uniref:hypothetical protein n=2 Tax=Streptomyces diastaticus TaxID=1956 RepID=UPI00364DD3C3